MYTGVCVYFIILLKKASMTSELDLLKVSAFTCLQVSTYAQLLESQFGEFFKPEAPGIYVANEVFPRIVPGKSYFSLTQVNKPPTLITDFNVVKTAVLTEGGGLVIPKYMMQDKAKYLSNEPTIPAKFYILIELLIKNHILTTSSINTIRPDVKKIFNLLKEECYDIYEEGYLTTACRSLLDQVDNFVGDDTWHMYFSKIVGHDVHVEKTIDWRIFQWEKEYGNAYRGITEKDIFYINDHSCL